MQRRLNWIAATALALALGPLAGCGGGGTPPNITAAAGGTVTSDDGRVTLVVPPGAASRDMTVRIVPATPTAPPQFGLLAGYGYALEGDGGRLSADAQIRMTFDPGVLPTAAAKDRTAAAAAVRRRALGAVLIPIPPIDCGSGFVELPVDPGNLEGAWYCEPSPRPPRIATVTPTAVVELGGCVFEAALRIASCLTADVSPKIFGVLLDLQPPTVSVAADRSSVTSAGDVVFSATATDNKAVSSVAITLTRSVGGVVDPASGQTTIFNAGPYTFTRSFTSADNGEWTVVAAASDFNKNVTITDGALKVIVDIPAPPGPDGTPPVVALGANTTTATVGDTVTLTATASDNVGVTKVEFFKGATLIGERLAAPYELTPAAFTAADVGVPQVFTAKAHDAAGNTSTSAAVTVAVSAVSTGDVYVNAGSGADSNAGTSAAPFKTLAKGFTAVGAGGTVWLQNGVHTAAVEGTDIVTGRTVPTGVTVRAVNPLGATLGFPLKFAGNGSVIGTRHDMTANAALLATTGTVAASRVQWVKLGAFGMGAALSLSGSAKLTLDTGGDPAHEYFAAVGVTALADVTGSAELTVNGGLIDRLSGAGGGYMANVADNAKLTLAGVTWTNAAAAVVAPTAINLVGAAPNVTLAGTSIDLTGAADFTGGGNACIRVTSGGATTAATITLDASTLSKCPGDGIQLREGTPTLVLKNGSQITAAGFHGVRAGIYGSASALARPAMSITNSQVVNSARSGVELLVGGSLSMTGAMISNNGLALANGGVRLLGAFSYGLSMRGSSVNDNFGDAGSGGVVVQGDASSTFDLGSKASPGGNTIRNNGGGSTGLRATVAAGVTVLAVGNTFNPSAQGANGSGQYTSASSVCGGANPCNVNSGSGVNFAISGGTLRLVDD